MGGKKLGISQEVVVELGAISLQGILTIPEEARGIVLFAHGSGSSRTSHRNQYVANYLADENIATLLMDLLTPSEDEEDRQTRQLRFNIPFLAKRLYDATDWVLKQQETHHLTLGYFGASTGAAAALIAASDLGEKIKAVVSRGGRPDLAGNALSHVKSPTLLIVGGADYGVIELNQNAYALLTCKKQLEVIKEATHLFEEPGALNQVSKLASKWFNTFL